MLLPQSKSAINLSFWWTVKPSLQVFRARFSEITPGAIRTACENLTQPNQNISDAVDVRQELDLRIGMGAKGIIGSLSTYKRLSCYVDNWVTMDIVA